MRTRSCLHDSSAEAPFCISASHCALVLLRDEALRPAPDGRGGRSVGGMRIHSRAPYLTPMLYLRTTALLQGGLPHTSSTCLWDRMPCESSSPLPTWHSQSQSVTRPRFM